MCKNLLKAGYEVVVLGRRQHIVDELIAAGARSAASPAEVASRVDVIITMLPNSPEVKEVVLGKDGVIEGAKAGSAVIDMSSISPLASREISQALAARSVEMLDAPVSGGEAKAVDGSLSVMVGGKQEVFEKYYAVLKAMAASVVRTGEIGAGNVTKLANQAIIAINIAAMSEAMVLATKVGVDPELVFEAIKGGLAGGAALNAKVPQALDRKFKAGFRMNLMIKDLANALDAGHGIGAYMPLTASVMEMMQALKVAGFGDEDHGALVRYFEGMAHVEVKRKT